MLQCTSTWQIHIDIRLKNRKIRGHRSSVWLSWRLFAVARNFSSVTQRSTISGLNFTHQINILIYLATNTLITLASQYQCFQFLDFERAHTHISIIDWFNNYVWLNSQGGTIEYSWDLRVIDRNPASSLVADIIISVCTCAKCFNKYSLNWL